MKYLLMDIAQKILHILPEPVQKNVARLIGRIQDADPERLQPTEEVKVVVIATSTVGWLPQLTLIAALGVFSASWAYTFARQGTVDSDALLWYGLIMMYVPIAIRQLMPVLSRFERISLLCLLGCSMYFIKVVSSPLFFTTHDEFLHIRTLEDIVRTGQLFSENSLLPVSPRYPGLELVTNALSSISGLNIVAAGFIVVGISRLVMILAFFLLNERLSASPRLAGLATLLYVSNPHFLEFDAMFSYESLALPLTTAALFAIAYPQRVGDERFPTNLIACLLLAAVAFTHHVTDYILNAILIAWSIMYLLQRYTPLTRTRFPQVNPIPFTIFSIGVAILNAMLFDNPVVNYIVSFVSGAIVELGGILTGGNSARQLFTDYAGQAAPVWQRITMLLSVLLIVLSIPFGLLCLWRRYRHNALICVFGIGAVAYPASQAFRFTTNGAELTDRAAAFLFFPISFVVALYIIHFWPIRRLKWHQTLLVSSALSIVFLGGTILGAGPPWEVMPGPYVVGADERSIEPESIQAAEWTELHLGANNRVSADRINRLLMSANAQQYVVTAIGDNIDLAPVYTSSTFGQEEIDLLREARLQYMIVDLRLSTALPGVGFYFEQGEEGSFQRKVPLSREALTKFDKVQQINRIFDSGNMVIYDVRELANAR